ncbi:MAG: hypothetical protein K2X08_06215 [Chlamydiales bacterium]|nr:hypothetical protein [Chlamydiales bacterium]
MVLNAKVLSHDTESAMRSTMDQVKVTLDAAANTSNKAADLVEQAGTFLTATQTHVQSALEMAKPVLSRADSVMQAALPLLTSANWCINVATGSILSLTIGGLWGGYKAINTMTNVRNDLKQTMDSCSEKGERITKAIEVEGNRAVDVLEKARESFAAATGSGSAAVQNVATEVHKGRRSFHKLCETLSKCAIGALVVYARSSVCSTNPDAFCCYVPSMNTMLFAFGVGLSFNAMKTWNNAQKNIQSTEEDEESAQLEQMYARLAQNSAAIEEKQKAIREACKVAQAEHEAEQEAHQTSQKADAGLQADIEAMRAKIARWKKV